MFKGLILLLALVIEAHWVLGFSVEPRANLLRARVGTAGSHVTMAASQPIPRDIKGTISALRSAVQEGLGKRKSRMEVELPYGARFGVEKVEKDGANDAPQDPEVSNRELARLFVEMFDPCGDKLICAFRSDKQAAAAKSIWGKGTYKGKVTSFAPKAKAGKALKGKASRKGGFAAKMEAAMGSPPASTAGAGIAPKGTEVLLVVAPGENELRTVSKVAAELGEECLIVLLNARLDELAQSSSKAADLVKDYTETYMTAFSLRPIGTADDTIFLVSTVPGVGPPQVLPSPSLPSNPHSLSHSHCPILVSTAPLARTGPLHESPRLVLQRCAWQAHHAPQP
ncbi:unnamed protein product [Chrysoparadoxa australica]